MSNQYTARTRESIANPNPRAGMSPFSRSITDWRVAHPKTVLDSREYPVLTTFRRSSQWCQEYRSSLSRNPVYRDAPYTLGHYVPHGPRDQWTKGQYGVYKEEQAAWRQQRDQHRLEGLGKKLEGITKHQEHGTRSSWKHVDVTEQVGYRATLTFSHRVPPTNRLVSPFVQRAVSEERKGAEIVEECPVIGTITGSGPRHVQSSIKDENNVPVTSRHGVQTLIAENGLLDEGGHGQGECYPVIQSYLLAHSARYKQ